MCYPYNIDYDNSEADMKIWKKLVLIILLIGLITTSVLIVIGYINYKNAVDEISIEDKIKEIKAKDHYTYLIDISDQMQQAIVAIEDRRFYEHHGVDYRSMGRALIDNVFANGIVGGGSTITQQLAKNMYFTYQASYIRKVSEIFVAYDLERLLNKDEILELYLNVINYGDGHIGIYEASIGYFGVEPSMLNLDQASLLAGLPQSPNNYQLSNHLKEAEARQKYVLDAMCRDGYITSELVDEALN